MSTNELSARVNEWRELCRMAEELEAEIDAIENEIRKHMETTEADEIRGTNYKITYKAFSSSRIDTTALKKAMPELAERFSKTRTIRRLCIT